jgi:hypothetical protein
MLTHGFLNPQVMWRECAADMEGGAPEEDEMMGAYGDDHHQQPQHHHHHHLQQQQQDGDDGDDSMFWDYAGMALAVLGVLIPPRDLPLCFLFFVGAETLFATLFAAFLVRTHPAS